jgi:hypothetical protein
MKLLAQRIESELRRWPLKHCAVYEEELQRLWPLEAKDREAHIAEFAKTYGLRLRFYQKGLCAIFDKWPREEVTQPSNARFGHIKLRDLKPVKDVTGGGGVKGKSKHRTGSSGTTGSQ